MAFLKGLVHPFLLKYLNKCVRLVTYFPCIMIKNGPVKVIPAWKVFLLGGFLLTFVLSISWYYLAYVESHNACKWQHPEDSEKPFPKIVHRIWFQGHEFPEKYKHNWDHCKEINPDYQFNLWSSDDIEKFVKQDYPWLMSVYEKYPYFVLQTDLARYLMLYHFGGIYIDLDLDCNVPFDQMLKNITNGKDYGVILGAGRPVGIGNSFMWAKTKHPFYKLMIENLQYHQGYYLTPYWTVMLSGGTLYVAKMYMKYPCSGDIKIISATLHNDVYLSHQHASSWHQTDGKIFIWFGAHLWFLFFLIIAAIVAIYVMVRRWQNSNNGKSSLR